MRLLLRNSSLSTDIGLRFNDQGWDQWPLTAEKYASWCHSFAASSEIINIFNDYHSFGLRNPRESGIFDFMEARRPAGPQGFPLCDARRGGQKN